MLVSVLVILFVGLETAKPASRSSCSSTAKRLTRSMRSDSHSKRCLEILEEPVPEFVVDEADLVGLLNKAVSVGVECSLTSLEKLYSLLAQCVYRHRAEYDRTAMVKVCSLFN